MDEIVSNHQLFVTGYSRSKVTDERDLRQIFRKYDSIQGVAYKGSYSFISFNSEVEAKEALSEMNGFTQNGEKLKVAPVENRKGRRTGPNENAGCFKCGQEGHWARDCPKGRSPRRNQRYSNSRQRHHRRRSDSRSHSSQSSSRSRRRNRDRRNRRKYSNSPKEDQKKNTQHKRRSPSHSQHHSTS
ncbi:unnamed protein product [Paramecium sonneborni]|uniref:Uncharacterized protein n=1 Tax=Paramecium sonneborni TaxID=65129 RepID=A0A8S1RH79_9CILI|nr:unnamed protein product [Paramecium sonneborni]